ncbi:prolyl hydroxylase family protein [Pseudofrancisella aestuarii]|uniref:Prolyl hydroxylase family protein n=1 Tax=Pseudofrancisella aestuarii TaxID=2670347 RepID=A0ABV9T9G5_9GAMM|nr:2OG-Fe(II) oxygenase [Pseudofrancisella aestuarii]
MITELDASWQAWVKENIERGCNKEELFKIMLDHQFTPSTIQAALGLKELSQYLKSLINNEDLDHKPQLYNLPEETFKTAQKVPSNKARAYIQPDFLSKEECEQVIARIKKNLRPSLITNPNEPDKYFRTSKTCDLGIHTDDFIKYIDHKIAGYLGIDPSCSEVIQGQYYQVGNEFKLHTDYFQPNTSEYKQFAARQGQRTWTFMIYLNNVEEGGHTDFPNLDLSVKPKLGTAVIWNSLDEKGVVNRNTLHWAKPIIKGEKYVITKWFRERAI